MLGIGTGINYASESAISTDLKQATSGTAAGLRLWLKNDTSVTAAKWTDSSGLDNHATQSTEGNQAAVSGGGLDFTPGNSDHYDLASTITISENQGFCIAVVIDQETISNNTILSKDADDQFQIVTNGRFRFRANDDTDTTTNFDVDGTPFDGNKMILLLNRSAGASNRFTMFKNGTQLTFNTDTSSNEAEGENPFGFDINVLGAKEGSSQFFDGKILELAFWNRSLTSQEITDVNSYLQSIHGL
jgi:hypothetical protein